MLNIFIYVLVVGAVVLSKIRVKGEIFGHFIFIFMFVWKWFRELGGCFN